MHAHIIHSSEHSEMLQTISITYNVAKLHILEYAYLYAVESADGCECGREKEKEKHKLVYIFMLHTHKRQYIQKYDRYSF